MWHIRDGRPWFAEIAHLSDVELRDLEIRALRTDAARAAIAAEAAAKRQTSWRHISRAVRRMLRRKK